MKYEILASDWYTTGRGELIGVVAIASGPAKENWKAYIGIGQGVDEAVDEQQSAGNGSKVVPASIAAAHFPSLDPDKFVY